jgi:predicted tellurium resistance membrane protein TerC
MEFNQHNINKLVNHFDHELLREIRREENMIDYAKSIVLTVFGMAMTAEGVRVMMTVGTSCLGFLTALLGFGVALMGFIYGWRKLKNQKLENEKEEE